MRDGVSGQTVAQFPFDYSAVVWTLHPGDPARFVPGVLFLMPSCKLHSTTIFAELPSI